MHRCRDRQLEPRRRAERQGEAPVPAGQGRGRVDLGESGVSGPSPFEVETGKRESDGTSGKFQIETPCEPMDSGLGLFYLSSIPTDRAEPSEGLKSTVVWQVGLEPSATLLSAEQLSGFRKGVSLETEKDVRGKAGAYLLSQTIELNGDEHIKWHIVADLNQDHSDVVALDEWLRKEADQDLIDDIEASELEFLRILSASDAMQISSNKRQCNRHFSNTVFMASRLL